MEKLTFKELSERTGWETAVIVFTEDTFDRDYSLTERSYEISRDAKYFNPNMNGTSLFGNCLDGKDRAVRLDIYMRHEGWKVDYCYITK